MSLSGSAYDKKGLSAKGTTELLDSKWATSRAQVDEGSLHCLEESGTSAAPSRPIASSGLRPASAPSKLDSRWANASSAAALQQEEKKGVPLHQQPQKELRGYTTPKSRLRSGKPAASGGNKPWDNSGSQVSQPPTPSGRLEGRLGTSRSPEPLQVAVDEKPSPSRRSRRRAGRGSKKTGDREESQHTAEKPQLTWDDFAPKDSDDGWLLEEEQYLPRF